MSLSIAQLYRQDENKYKLDLLAGRQGLSRDVAWVQVMEDADYGTFLRPHAFIFTTGLASHGDPHWLERFVDALLAADAAGLVVNTGKYLLPSDITEALKERCEEAAFPLFTMPWEVRLADITQSFLSALFLTNREEYRAITAWKEFLFGVQGSSVLTELALTAGRTRGRIRHWSWPAPMAMPIFWLTASPSSTGWTSHTLYFLIRTRSSCSCRERCRQHSSPGSKAMTAW